MNKGEDLVSLFDSRRFHSRVVTVARDLFCAGYFEQAVSEAFKAVENYVKEKSGRDDLYGHGLMGVVFNEKDPILRLNPLKTVSDQDEQAGFKFLFMGAVKGIRNPRAHETLEHGEPFEALEYLALASLLMRRVDNAVLTMQADEIIRLVEQQTFVRSNRYVEAILTKVPASLYVVSAEKLIEKYISTEDERIRENVFFVYRMLVQRLDEDSLRSISAEVNRVLDEDATFAYGVKLLQPHFVRFLEAHIVEKLFGFLVEDIKRGMLNRGLVSGSEFWQDVIRLRRAIPAHHIEDLVDVLRDLLYNGNWYQQGFAVRILQELQDVIPESYLPMLMKGVMRALLHDTSFSAMDEVSQALESYSESWIIAFCESLLREHDFVSGDKGQWLELSLKNPHLPDSLRGRVEEAISLLSNDDGLPPPEDEIPF